MELPTKVRHLQPRKLRSGDVTARQGLWNGVNYQSRRGSIINFPATGACFPETWESEVHLYIGSLPSVNKCRRCNHVLGTSLWCCHSTSSTQHEPGTRNSVSTLNCGLNAVGFALQLYKYLPVVTIPVIWAYRWTPLWLASTVLFQRY